MTTKRRKRKPDAAVSEAARLLAARGARKGGRARAQKLSPEERSRIAARGGKARWGLPAEEDPTPGRRLARSA